MDVDQIGSLNNLSSTPDPAIFNEICGGLNVEGGGEYGNEIAGEKRAPNANETNVKLAYVK